jgi:predicted acylesterase/phospholipase RssA
VAPGNRDVAVVLSGGGINGVLLELGFLKRLRASDLWPRIGWIYGTSAGALSGTLAALDRLDDLERFLLDLQAEDAFRQRPLWQMAGGLHDYTLPETIAARLDPAGELGTALADCETELVVIVTDVSGYLDVDDGRTYELLYSSHSTEPDTMGRAILASAAVSGLVLPLEVDGVIATDGGWVRNFPLQHAYENPQVGSIVAFRYVASYRPTNVAFLERIRERLDRFRAVPPVRALLEEIHMAEERAARGEPAHYGELIVRLMRVTIARNTVLEERLASDRETSVVALRRLREEVVETAVRAAPPWRRRKLRAALDDAFSSAGFPFRHDRHVPMVVVRGTPGEHGLDPTYRSDLPWAAEDKLALVERGYRLTDEALAGSG